MLITGMMQVNKIKYGAFSQILLTLPENIVCLNRLLHVNAYGYDYFFGIQCELEEQSDMGPEFAT